MKKTLSVLLALLTVISGAAVFSQTSLAAERDEPVSATQYAQTNICGSAILHCFLWSYNQVKNNLPDIAEAGYTAVQVCPVQKPKDYYSDQTDPYNIWWTFYQPYSLSVADGNNWLGTKTELQAMCAEADKYNIKVIADIVCNHMANNGAEGGGYASLSPNVEQSMQNAAYYHVSTTKVYDESRGSLTQDHLGSPDLNTGNPYVQGRVISLMKECVDLGVDGFRFDAAKHIELPSDDPAFRSDFWPNVVNGIRDYCTQKGLPAPYMYGEILGTAGTDISNYTRYINVTEDVSSNWGLEAARDCDAYKLQNYSMQKGESPAQAVMWAESHDTYFRDNNPTSSIANSIINKAWAISGSRAESTSLFFARPASVFGNEADPNWKSTAVKAVNKFKNYFNGQSEYLSCYDQTAYNERGTAGVSIAKLNGGGWVSLPAHTMASGTYKDQVSGNTFYVRNGKIEGTVGSSGVAVVYNAPNESATTEPTTAKPTTIPTTEPTTAEPTEPPTTTVTVGDVTLDGVIDIRDATAIQRHTAVIEELSALGQAAADCSGDGSISITDATEIQKYIAHLSANDSISSTLTVTLPEETTEEPTTEEPTTIPPTTAPPTTVPQNYTLTFSNSKYWGGTIYCYYWSDSNTNMVVWPGKTMTYSYTNEYNQGVYTFSFPASAKYAIFTNGNGCQTVNITITGSARYYATDTTDSQGHYNVATW